MKKRKITTGCQDHQDGKEENARFSLFFPSWSSYDSAISLPLGALGVLGGENLSHPRMVRATSVVRIELCNKALYIQNVDFCATKQRGNGSIFLSLE